MLGRKSIFLIAIALITQTLCLGSAQAQNVNLKRGEYVTVVCGNKAINPVTPITPGSDQQCWNENANLRAQISNLQNDLYNCQNSAKSSCRIKCGTQLKGFGSGRNNGEACQNAKENSNLLEGRCVDMDCICE